MNTNDKPPSVTDDRLAFLDAVMESETARLEDMPQYLRNEYLIGTAESEEIVQYWREVRDIL